MYMVKDNLISYLSKFSRQWPIGRQERHVLLFENISFCLFNKQGCMSSWFVCDSVMLSSLFKQIISTQILMLLQRKTDISPQQEEVTWSSLNDDIFPGLDPGERKLARSGEIKS